MLSKETAKIIKNNYILILKALFMIFHYHILDFLDNTVTFPWWNNL